MDARLVCPITINAGNAPGTPDAILDAFLTSSISVLAASPSLVAAPGALTEVPDAICLGCTDGSVFVLRASHCGDDPQVANVLLSPTQSSPQVALSPRIRPQQLPSRISTPTGPSKKPFLPYSAPQGLISAPIRAASNVDTLQVEAPKAQVQHNDEEGKLRALLRQSGQQPESSNSHNSSRLSDRAIETNGDPRIERVERRPTVKPMKSKIIIKSASNDASRFHSGSSSPTSWSRQASSISSPTLPYHLSHHIMPSQTGPNHAVVAVKHLVEGRFTLILQESGNLGIYSNDDGTCVISLDLGGPPRCRAPEGFEDVPLDTRAWQWCKIDILSLTEESIVMCVCARDPFEFSQLETVTGDMPWTTRAATLQMNPLNLRQLHPNRSNGLELLAEWIAVTPAMGCGMFHPTTSPSSLAFYCISDSKLQVRKFTIEPRVTVLHSSTNAVHADLLTGAANAIQAIPHNLAAFSKEWRSPRRHRHPRQASLYLNSKDELLKLPSSRVKLSAPHELASIHDTDPPLRGSHFWPSNSLDDGLSCFAMWTNDTLMLYPFYDNSMLSKELSSRPDVGVINCVDVIDTGMGRILVSGSSAFAVLQIENGCLRNAATSCNRDKPTDLDASCLLRVSFNGPHSTYSHPQLGFLHSPERMGQKPLLVTRKENLISEIPVSSADTLWFAPALERGTLRSQSPHVCSALPVELKRVILGFSDGFLRSASFADILCRFDVTRCLKSDHPLGSGITGLHLTHARQKDSTVVGSSEDGALGIWDLETLNLRARWTLFCCPLRRVITVPSDHSGRLQGCMICAAEDGTLAVIELDGFELLYLVPGSIAPIERVCVGSDNLLLLYGNARTRLWDTRTLEFWRSMGQDKVVELLDQGGWFESTMEHPRPLFGINLLRGIEGHADTADIGRTILLDCIAFIEFIGHHSSNKSQRPIRSTPEPDADATNTPIEQGPRPLDHDEAASAARALLSSLLTFGINEVADKICTDHLRISPSHCSAGGQFSVGGSTILYANARPTSPWEISPVCTARRLLLIIMTLRAAGLLQGHDVCLYFRTHEHPTGDLQKALNDIMSFYVHSLPAAVGPTFQSPSIVYLASFWFEQTVEVRQAARTLFDAAVVQASDAANLAVLEAWQHELPTIQPDIDRDAPTSALALVLCGNVAIEKLALFSPSLLTDISRSIMLYLHDESSPHRIVAVDLGARGFHIWQNYISAMELLRSLFRLASNYGVGSTSSTGREGTRVLAQQARSGVMHIATHDTPLFISTISLDIMDATSVMHRNSTMQLIAFIIRKKPMILYPNLPRLVEAVVKSLDPNFSSKRDAVLDSAVEFLGEVVRTYPTIDFHSVSQKLAVGTSEGVIVMYDLKTASRLYVLEGHKRPLVAIAFSPDGRRLVTVSLEEGVVMVWKVGASFSNFFSLPGAPPRQGGSTGSEPYKVFPITLPNSTARSTDTFPDVSFEWPASRSARVAVRGSVFTFAT